MNPKKLLFLVCLGLLVVGFSWPAFACQFGKRAEIMIKAPLDAVDCTPTAPNTPPNITVLGLKIDISKASREGSCSNLIGAVGQVVEVELASGNPVPSTGFLLATEVEIEEGACHDSNVGGVIIAAPIQAVDTTKVTVTVLGLVVDVSQAIIRNNDDDGPLNISQVAPGQFAFLMLPSNQTPLKAAWMGVRQVEIKVRAPIDTIDCTKSIISVLGAQLTIDIGKATLYNGDENLITCGDLTVGQVVTVTLASDTPGTNGLPATEVETAKNNCYDSIFGGVKIFAPLQKIDPNGTNVTVLGQVIDITNAFPKCDADDGPISLNQWEVGQFAMVFLASEQPPLSATFLWVHKVEIKVQGPLDAVNCEATPPFITVLGLKIDISKTNLFNSDTYRCNDNLTCANLAPGQVVKVTLASDIPDQTTNLLPATKIEMEVGAWYSWNDDDISNVKIAAPIEDINGNNVTVLGGLVIDISQAILELDNGLPIKASQLSKGQFVKLTLASNQPPLTAIILVAQASSVQATVQVLDNKGNPVNDGAGNVQAEVTVGQGKKALKFHFTGNGSFYLSGLPTGKANIVVTRVHNGQKSMGSKSFTVKANKIQYLTIRLKPVSR